MHPGIARVDILARDLDCVGQPCIDHVADGSLVTVGTENTIVSLGDIDAAFLAPNDPGPVGDDASQLALLQSVGFSGTRPPFIVAEGAPNPFAAAPEPATWVMLVIGFGAVGSTARRGRAARSVR